MNLIPLALIVASCSPAGRVQPPTVFGPSNVLVVWNANAPESRAIEEAYAAARHIPQKNILAVKVTTDDNIAKTDYVSGILTPVFEKIKKDELDIDYIVLIRGVPIRLDNDGGFSLDSYLAVEAFDGGKETASLSQLVNPYFKKAEPFDSKKYHYYLCTRLDGYTVDDTLNLIKNSLHAKANDGPFLLDAAPGRTGGGYGQTQNDLIAAAKILKAKKMTVKLDEGEPFVGGKGLAGYASWGSNDAKFDMVTYNSLTFLPGAIGETYVSTSGRTFRHTSGGQSLIADLIHQGITGIKGYVSEPYTIALAHVDVLFDRYTKGYNLAESFYMASPLLKWKDVVIGDPLCSPYPKVSN